MSTYYEILGVPKHASDAEIRKAFWRLAKEWHPDRNKIPEAEERFKEINEAYQVLSDSAKRALHDREGIKGRILVDFLRVFDVSFDLDRN